MERVLKRDIGMFRLIHRVTFWGCTSQALAFLIGFVLLIISTSLPLYAAGLNLSQDEQAYLDSKPDISVLALDTFPPFSFSDAGTTQGYSIDYMNKMGQVLNKKIRFVSGIPWFEALNQLKAGKLDIIPAIAVTEERKAYISFTPYNHIEYVTAAVFHRDRADRQLNEQIVAVAKNTFLHSYLKRNYPATPVLATSTTDEAVLAVANGRADIAIGSQPSLNFYLQKHWLSNLMSGQVKGLDLPLRTALPMGVKKGNTLLSSVLTKAHQAIPYDQVSGLKDKWMQEGARSDHMAGLSPDQVAFLARHRELNICVDPDWMPLESVQNGEHIGISAELVALIAERLNVRFNRVPSASWDASLRLGRDGGCDLFPLIMQTEGRKTFLSFTQPLVESPLVMITQVNEPYLPDLKHLKKKRIGIVKAYAFGPALEAQYPDLEFVAVDNIRQGLSWVRDGHLYGYIDSLITSGYWIQNHYLGQLKVSNEIDRFWQLSMGVRKELEPLVPILNQAISGIPDSQRQDIIGRWISIRYEQRHDWLITLLGVLITALISGGVILWYIRLNTRLEKEVTRRKEAEQKALNLAHTDQLTGIMNRHGAEPVIDQEIARCHRYGTPVVMMILDVDHFKRINDTEGHKVGDDALRWLSRTLEGAMRSQDLLVRWGGEEFLILLPQTPLSDAEELAERYRFLIEAGSAKAVTAFTISIGVAELHAGETFSHWYQRSDLALYQAKNSGRNRVVIC